MTKATFAALLLALLSACTIGPKYVAPSAPVPPAYKDAGAASAGEWRPAQPGDELGRGKWWERFNDHDLNALEEKVSISNQSVAAAAANVQAARAAIREAQAQFFPTVTANPAIANSRISSAFGQSAGINYTTYSLPLEASWEPDLWGRVRKTKEANAFAAQAAVADLENVRLSAQCDLAADYYQLRAQDALKRLLDATVVTERETFELARDLMISGLGNGQAVAQAEAQLKVTEAQDTSLGVLRAQYEHAIALLDGAPASTFSIQPRAFEASLPAIPTGLPSELLERRPDIAAAERSVAQANAQIGIAKAAFYPSVTLSAAIGLGSVSAASWFTWPSRVWSVGPALAQTLFDSGLRKATVQQVQATYDQTVANYRQTVLTAFQQVEDNLTALGVLRETVEQEDSAVVAAEQNLEEAEARYRAGLDPYLNVLAARTVMLNDQVAVVNFRAQQMVAGIQLIKALGGGWDVSRIPSVPELGVNVRDEHKR